MQVAPGQLRQWAIVGAHARLAELLHERFRLEAFLRENGESVSAVMPTLSTAPRARRSMSAAERAAVSRRMKKYWAARRRGAAVPAKER